MHVNKHEFNLFTKVLLYFCAVGKVSESSSVVSPHQNTSQTSDQKNNEDGYTPLQFGQFITNTNLIYND